MFNTKQLYHQLDAVSGTASIPNSAADAQILLDIDDFATSLKYRAFLSPRLHCRIISEKRSANGFILMYHLVYHLIFSE